MPTTTRRSRKTATAKQPATTTTPPTDDTTPDDTTVRDDTATRDAIPTPDDVVTPTAPTPFPATPATEPAPAATTDETTAPPAAPDASPPASPDASLDTASATTNDAPASGAPVSGAPVGSGDRLKIVMVAGILGDHPDGVTAAAIVEESGLRAAIVGRVLAAMETAGAATRKPADTADESGTPGAELWVHGEADLETVSLAAVATYHECTCGHRHRVASAVRIRATGPVAPGHNSDGQRTLGKNELRAIVKDFLWAHPGHEFTPTTISKEIRRSSGAIGNALDNLVNSGEAEMVKEAPATFSAPDAATTPADADPATTPAVAGSVTTGR